MPIHVIMQSAVVICFFSVSSILPLSNAEDVVRLRLFNSFHFLAFQPFAVCQCFLSTCCCFSCLPFAYVLSVDNLEQLYFIKWCYVRSWNPLWRAPVNHPARRVTPSEQSQNSVFFFDFSISPSST